MFFCNYTTTDQALADNQEGMNMPRDEFYP